MHNKIYFNFHCDHNRNRNWFFYFIIFDISTVINDVIRIRYGPNSIGLAPFSPSGSASAWTGSAMKTAKERPKAIVKMISFIIFFWKIEIDCSYCIILKYVCSELTKIGFAEYVVLCWWLEFKWWVCSSLKYINYSIFYYSLGEIELILQMIIVMTRLNFEWQSWFSITKNNYTYL